MHGQLLADPLNEHITTDSFASERQSVVERVENLRNYHHYFQLLFFLCVLGPALYLLVLTGSPTVGIFGGIAALFFGYCGMLLLQFALKSLENDLTLYLLCEEKKWVLNPVHDKVRPRKMAHLFPAVFDRGYMDSWRFDNQIWGTIGKKEVSFWCVNFYYELTRDAHFQDLQQEVLNPEDRDIHEKTVFVLELAESIPYEFHLGIRQLFKDGSIDYSKGSDFKTESVAFNKRIDVKIPHISKEKKRHVVQLLSPSVQVRLVDFVNTFPIESITFQHNCMVVVFAEVLWQTKHTNFLKQVKLDERDIAQFDMLFNEMVELPLEMRKFLD